MKTLRDIGFTNVSSKCEDVVREALCYGLDAGDIKRCMAQAWQEVLADKARWGAEELLAVGKSGG